MSSWAEFKPRAILRLLTARGVDFVVVGGYAAVLHGSPRVTQDLDICHSTEPSNLEMLSRVLLDLHARLFAVEEEVPFVPDSRTLARVELLTLMTDLGKLDVMTSPAGAPSYKRLRAGAEMVDVGGFAIRIASIGDLLAMKRAADRPKDRADVVELEAIERVRRER